MCDGSPLTGCTWDPWCDGRAQGKFARALNAFTLSLRADGDNDVVRRKMKRCVERLQPTPQQAAPDIEDVISRHDVVGLHDTFKFECTGCGECCRNVDHIFLSPADLFRMSRSENMAVRYTLACGALRMWTKVGDLTLIWWLQTQGITSTTTLRRKYPEAFKFSTKDHVPVRLLRELRCACCAVCGAMLMLVPCAPAVRAATRAFHTGPLPLCVPAVHQACVNRGVFASRVVEMRPPLRC